MNNDEQAGMILVAAFQCERHPQLSEVRRALLRLAKVEQANLLRALAIAAETAAALAAEGADVADLQRQVRAAAGEQQRKAESAMRALESMQAAP